ncbi:MAG: hypothetical protein J5971_04060 [Prevotella sp.]|nr:hypothetical protein [Prevotella sp.]
MNKQTIITILLVLAALTSKAQVKSHVIGSVAEGTTPVELVIYRDGEDPKDSKLRPVVKDGHFECDVEDAQIERWHIVDLGEVMEKGMTSRSEAFFVEDGATITIRLDGDKFDIQSTGKEYQAWHAMNGGYLPSSHKNGWLPQSCPAGALSRMVVFTCES